MDISEQIGNFLKSNGLKLATAESCTAGMISSLVAQTPGSSLWLDAGFVVYSAEAKNSMLGVSFDTINKFDITSTEVAQEMAKGAILKSNANVAVSTTGLAGPSGGTQSIPIGTVCFGWSFKIDDHIVVFSEKMLFKGNRNEIREEAALYALNKISFYHHKIYNKQNKVKI